MWAMIQKSPFRPPYSNSVVLQVCVPLRSSYAGSQNNACIRPHEAAVLLQVNHENKAEEQRLQMFPFANITVVFLLPAVKRTFQHFCGVIGGRVAPSRYKDELFATTPSETVQ